MTILALDRSPFYWEALRMADHAEIFDFERRAAFVDQRCKALAVKAFREEIEPYLKIRANLISSLYFTPIILREGGTYEVMQPKYTPEMQFALDAVNILIDASAKRYGLELER